MSYNLNHNQSDNFDKWPTLRILSPGTLLAKRYEILSNVGRGAMGEVYLARDRQLGIEVAVKILPTELSSDEQARESLKNEARNALLLSHPNIMRLHNLEQDGDIVFLVMEYINGPTFARILVQRSKLDSQEVVPLAKQICEGLSSAHKQRILHLDLKPSNIMIQFESRQEEDILKKSLRDYPEYTVKITDFSISRRMHDSMARISNKKTSGTLLYMSPEQINGEAVDQRSDIYSLGVVLYEMLSSHPPFYEGDIRYQITSKEAKEIHAVPKSVNNIVMRCLSKNREQRYPGADEVLKALDSIGKGGGGGDTGSDLPWPLPAEIEKWIKIYRETLSIEPNLAATNLRLGLAYHKKKDYKNAIVYLQKYLELKPDANNANAVKKIISEASVLREFQ